MSDQEVYRQGKFVVTVMPEVYIEFVKELTLHHKELNAALAFAQVKLDDGSAFVLLNEYLGTQVQSGMPAALGYALLLKALKRRTANDYNAAQIRAMRDSIADERQQNVDFQLGSGVEVGKGLFYDPNNPDDIGAQPK